MVGGLAIHAEHSSGNKRAIDKILKQIFLISRRFTQKIDKPGCLKSCETHFSLKKICSPCRYEACLKYNQLKSFQVCIKLSWMFIFILLFMPAPSLLSKLHCISTIPLLFSLFIFNLIAFQY